MYNSTSVLQRSYYTNLNMLKKKVYVYSTYMYKSTRKISLEIVLENFNAKIISKLYGMETKSSDPLQI